MQGRNHLSIAIGKGFTAFGGMFNVGGKAISAKVEQRLRASSMVSDKVALQQDKHTIAGYLNKGSAQVIAETYDKR